MTFSSNLKSLREEKGVSQREIADYLGVTRQAVAFYELGKRQPDFQTLARLADYFDVSVDYLLGRTTSKELDSKLIGKNIKIIRQDLSYEEFSKDISDATGFYILPKTLKDLEEGDGTAYKSFLKILTAYAKVREDFFYRLDNTIGSYEQEKIIYAYEKELISLKDSSVESLSKRNIFVKSIFDWIIKEDNYKYVEFAKEMQEFGVNVDAFRPILTSLK